MQRLRRMRSFHKRLRLVCHQSKSRSKNGTMIVLIVASVLLLSGLGYFTYNIVTAFDAQAHLTRALNAAALAAAADLGRIVIDDPKLGFVGLTDRPPISGTTLVAGDNFALPVRSINSLLATARLDMIAADIIGSTTMKRLAAEDYRNTLNAQGSLIKAMQSSISVGSPKPTDAYGQPVDAYSDAQSIYRLDGGLPVSGSTLTLTLGCCPDLPTNISVPQPTASAKLQSGQFTGNYYNAFMDVPYDNYAFVFSAMGLSPSLTDGTNFSTSPKNLPYVLPDVVCVHGSEKLTAVGLFTAPSIATIQASAYAFPGAPPQPISGAGSLAISFPDGNIPELKSVQNLLVDPTLQTVVTNIGQAVNGDYPAPKSALQQGTKTLPSWFASPSGAGTNPSVGNCCELVFYDWLRRCGYTANLSSIVNLMKTPLSPVRDTLSPFMDVFSFNQDGTIAMSVLQLEQHYCQSSDGQPVFITAAFNPVPTVNTVAVESAARGYVYDLLIQDNVRQPGDINGGAHGGQPIVDNRLTTNPPFPDSSYVDERNELTGTPVQYTALGWTGKAGGWAYGRWEYPICRNQGYLPWVCGGDNQPETLSTQPTASHTGAERPTYRAPGLAAEIAFHKVFMGVAMNAN